MSANQRAVFQMDAKGNRRARSRDKPLLEGFTLSRTGLQIEESVDQRTWYEFGKLLQQVDYAWEWMVADWLVFGDHKYGDQVYTLAARLLGKAPRTWEDYAYVARNVKISERSEVLPILTHKPVARFAPDARLQRELLALAEQHGLSKAVFESVIRLYIKKKSYKHLLPSQSNPISRASVRAASERERVRKRALKDGGNKWLVFAIQQVDGWQQLVDELQAEGSKSRMR